MLILPFGNFDHPLETLANQKHRLQSWRVPLTIALFVTKTDYSLNSIKHHHSQGENPLSVNLLIITNHSMRNRPTLSFTGINRLHNRFGETIIPWIYPSVQ